MEEHMDDKLNKKIILKNILFNLKGLKTLHFLVCEQNGCFEDVDINQFIERFNN